MTHAFSFNIIDTCFVRACGFPHNLFDILAYKVLGENSDTSIRADFTWIRINGEKKARSLSPKKEITLKDIYDCCSFEGLTTLSNQGIARLEIETEKEQLIPVYAIKQQIEQIHQQAQSVFYISDMYLPSDFLMQLLMENGFWKEGDKLYVSSKYGITKHSGRLYKYIAQENKLPFKQWEHCGDNKYSDYKIPKKLGIKAKLIQHKFLFYEKFMLKQSYFTGFFVHQHLAGMSKAIRLSFPDNIRYTFATDLIAPLYVPFVYRLLKNANEKKIKKIFFLARDGFILYRIAQNLVYKFPDIEVKYLYVSRSSLYFPGLNCINPETIYSLTQNEFGLANNSLGIVLSNFIHPEILKEIEQILPTINDKKPLQQAIQELFGKEDAIAVLNRYHAEQQEYVTNYFIQEGLASKTYKTAIVDVRGTRSCHQVINNILKEAGYNLAEGYYLEVVNKRKNIQDAGLYHSLFYQERYLNNPSLKYISEIANILEEYFSMAPHPRTICYKKESGSIKPLFDQENCPAYKQDIVQQHVAVMNKYCHHFLSNCLHHHELAFLSVKLISSFAEYPNYLYLKALKDMPTTNSNVCKEYMVKKLSFKDIKSNRIYWKKGSLYLTLKSPYWKPFIDLWLYLKHKTRLINVNHEAN